MCTLQCIRSPPLPSPPPSPYATPTKQSLVSSEDVVMVVGPQQSRENSSSKAVSDSSLNNILDSSGLPVRNIIRRPTILADEVSPLTVQAYVLLLNSKVQLLVVLSSPGCGTNGETTHTQSLHYRPIASACTKGRTSVYKGRENGGDGFRNSNVSHQIRWGCV